MSNPQARTRACAHSNQIEAYRDGELKPQERAQFESHLAECAPCRAHLHELQAITLALRSYALPQAGIASNAEFWKRLAPRLRPRLATSRGAQQRLAFLPPLGLAISSAALQGLALLVSIVFLLQRWNRLPDPAALDVTPLARPLVGPLAWDLGARLVDNLHVSSALTWPVVGEWAILAAWTSALGILVLLSGLYLGWLVHWVRNSN